MLINKLYPPENNSFVINDLLISVQTLFGALANCYVKLYGSSSFNNFIEVFQDNYQVSSIFPALRIANKEIFFIPKPLLNVYIKKGDDNFYTTRKEIGEIKWVSTTALNSSGFLVNENNELFINSTIVNSGDYYIIDKAFLIHKNDLTDAVENHENKNSIINYLNNEKLYKETIFAKVTVTRFIEEATPFSQREISLLNKKIDNINLQTFFYFFENRNLKNTKINATKELFIEEGIGGKRNLGKGYFDKIETEEVSIEDKKQNRLLLSNMFPEKDDLKKMYSYEIGRDDGYVTFFGGTTIKKDPVHYFKPGSVLKEKCIGKIIHQQSDKKNIYRYGKGFSIPLNQE